jgi:hypothetical protein
MTGMAKNVPAMSEAKILQIRFKGFLPKLITVGVYVKHIFDEKLREKFAVIGGDQAADFFAHRSLIDRFLR